MKAPGEIYYYNWHSAKMKEIQQPTKDNVQARDNAFQKELLSRLDLIPGIFSSKINNIADFEEKFYRYVSDLTKACDGDLNNVQHVGFIKDAFVQAINSCIAIKNELIDESFLQAVVSEKSVLDVNEINNLFSYDAHSVYVKSMHVQSVGNSPITCLNVRPNNGMFAEWFYSLEKGCHSLGLIQMFKHDNYVSFNTGPNTPGIMIKPNEDGISFNIANNLKNQQGDAAQNLLTMVNNLHSTVRYILTGNIGQHYNSNLNTLSNKLAEHSGKYPLPPVVTVVPQPLYSSHIYSSHMGHSFFNQVPTNQNPVYTNPVQQYPQQPHQFFSGYGSAVAPQAYPSAQPWSQPK